MSSLPSNINALCRNFENKTNFCKVEFFYQNHVAVNKYKEITETGIPLRIHSLHVFTVVKTIFYGMAKDNDLVHITFKYSSGHLCIKEK